MASPENATQRYLYRAPLDGQGDPVRVTPAEFTGSNAYTISPDGRFATHRYSRFDDPGISELVTLPEHKRVSLIDDNAALKQKVAALLKPPVEYFKVDAGDGVQVDGYMLKPADFDASKRYPVLVHIYGEPAGQTVEDRWGGTAALYHRHLASLGYLVVSFDNSGTPAPRGRAWRKAIYGAVGVLSSKQQAQALRSLAAARSYVDLDRVAVWGWSGGGTNTLNLMFRSPELYKVGMSVAPVPDQRLYDTIYQERYMGLPGRQHRGLQAGVGDQLRGGAQRQPADRPRIRRRQRSLSGHRAAREPADRARQTVRLHDLPGPHPRHLGRARNDAAPLSPADALSHDAPARRPAGSVAVADSRRRRRPRLRVRRRRPGIRTRRDTSRQRSCPTARCRRPARKATSSSARRTIRRRR